MGQIDEKQFAEMFRVEARKVRAREHVIEEAKAWVRQNDLSSRPRALWGAEKLVGAVQALLAAEQEKP